MAKVLHVRSSPHGKRSRTRQCAEDFLAAYAELNPADEIETIDVWEAALPPFDGETIDAKLAVLRRQEFTPAQEARWNAVREFSQRFNSADKYVLSVPMWNFGIPYRLKHFIDVVTLAGENWTWSRECGYQSLLRNKKALAIYSSAGPYPAGVPSYASDFQKPYLRQWLLFVGVNDVREINVAPTLAEAEVVAKAIAQARLAAVEIAKAF